MEKNYAVLSLRGGGQDKQKERKRNSVKELERRVADSEPEGHPVTRLALAVEEN